jgi:hypothetical protein
VAERAANIAEWVRLTDGANKGASCADIPRTRGQPKGGINAAVRELGIDRSEACSFEQIVRRPHLWTHSAKIADGIRGERVGPARH